MTPLQYGVALLNRPRAFDIDASGQAAEHSTALVNGTAMGSPALGTKDGDRIVQADPGDGRRAWRNTTDVNLTGARNVFRAVAH
jgi:hypothetical protein